MCSAIQRERKKEKNREETRVQYVKTRNKYKQKEIHEKVKIQSNNNKKIYANYQSMINQFPVKKI